MMDGICGCAKKHESVDKQEDDDDKTNSNDTQVTYMTSPFIAYNDGYTFPNLYQETNDMLQASVLVYPMAELRRLAREGILEDVPHILQLPQTATQVLQAVNTHENVLLGTGALDNYFQFDILKNVQKQHDNKTQLVAFDDEFQQHELVYAICFNPLHKRITVRIWRNTTRTSIACITRVSWIQGTFVVGILVDVFTFFLFSITQHTMPL